MNFPRNRAIIKRLADEIEDYKKNSVVDQGFDVLTGKTILKEDEEGPSKELQKGFKDFLSKNAIVHSGKFGVIINNKRESVKFVELVMCIGVRLRFLLLKILNHLCPILSQIKGLYKVLTVYCSCLKFST